MSPPLKMAAVIVVVGLLYAAYARLAPKQAVPSLNLRDAIFTYDRETAKLGQDNILKEYSFDLDIPAQISNTYQIDYITDVFNKGKPAKGSLHTLSVKLDGKAPGELKNRLSLYVSTGLSGAVTIKAGHGKNGAQATTEPFVLSRDDIGQTNITSEFQPYPSGPLSVDKPNILGMFRIYSSGEDSKKRYYQDEYVQVLVSVTFTPFGKKVNSVSGPPPFKMMPKLDY